MFILVFWRIGNYIVQPYRLGIQYVNNEYAMRIIWFMTCRMRIALGGFCAKIAFGSAKIASSLSRMRLFNSVYDINNLILYIISFNRRVRNVRMDWQLSGPTMLVGVYYNNMTIRQLWYNSKITIIICVRQQNNIKCDCGRRNAL